ncbi:hypothetical protein [Stenotrophomonas maltophilia]|uniref:hypothetical protein n=1 Tax=Stenotrophomonas maltophilia TaxID=40324 RepID=UPI0039F674B4
MSSRHLSEFAKANPGISDLLEVLVSDSPPDRYGEVMRELGQHLARAIASKHPFPEGSAKDICVVCTVEDADFLAKGVLGGLQDGGVPAARLHLYCIWNDKVRNGAVSLSPIKKRYAEAFDQRHVVFVVVKSIISGACVVKTNLTRALSDAKDAEVIVAAPVMLKGAQKRLASEFPPGLSDRFEYVWFAEDNERDGDVVIPGIGGLVYERLGIKNVSSHMPEIVRERRRTQFDMAK